MATREQSWWPCVNHNSNCRQPGHWMVGSFLSSFVPWARDELMECGLSSKN